MPATRAAAAAATAATADSTEMDSTAPAAPAPADGRQPGASSGRRETGTASGQPTPAVTPAAPTSAAHMATATATGGRRGAAAAAEVLTPATAANSTATAVAAEAAAEVEATAADIKSGPRSGISVLPLFFCTPSIFCIYDQKLLSCCTRINSNLKILRPFIHHFPMFTEARMIQTIAQTAFFSKIFFSGSLLHGE